MDSNLLHQHDNLKFVQGNTRRTADLPVLERHERESRIGDWLVILSLTFGLGVAVGLYL